MKDISWSPENVRNNLNDYKTNFKTMNSVKQSVKKKINEPDSKFENVSIFINSF